MNRLETGIKDGFEEMEHEFPAWNICPETHRTTFSDVPLLPEIFRWIAPNWGVFNLLSNRIFWKLFSNGQQPPTVPANRLKNLAVMRFFFYKKMYGLNNEVTVLPRWS